MKQFFDERVLGAREGWQGEREQARKKRENEWVGFQREDRYLDLFSRIGFLRAGGNSISGFHVPRQLH